jgi:class 3 adenylate cyclase
MANFEDINSLKGGKQMSSDLAFNLKAVLTVDIVEFSKKSLKEQMGVTQALIELLRNAVPEEENHPSRRIWSPAGDGGCLTFLENTLAAIKTAVALGRLINRYNKYIKGEIACKDVDERIQDETKLPRSENPFQIRSGIHIGPVVKQIDFDERQNIWGYGINIATRVASLAKPGQIVVSEDYYRGADLEFQKEYKTDDIGTWWAKHNLPLRLYNVYVEDDDGAIGIPVTEVEGWYIPFHRPLQQVISIYATMLDKEKIAHRLIVLAKRILDLCPDENEEEHQKAKQAIKRISKTTAGEEALFNKFFSYLSPDALLYFCRITHFYSFNASELIFKQGEDADSMMLVVSGQIELYLDEQLIPDVTLTEGDIIGEMELFNPAGRKRTATLKASQDTITLSLDYRFLEEGETSSQTQTEIKSLFGSKFLESVDTTPSIIEEIREQMWNLYCERTKQNQLRNVQLFQALPKDHLNELVAQSEFLPHRYHENIQLTANDAWEYLTLIVEGSITVETTRGNRLTFTKNDCLGTLSLVVDNLPYAKIQVSPNTHLVRLPWKVMEKFLDSSPGNKFYVKKFEDACLLNAGRSRKRLKELGKESTTEKKKKYSSIKWDQSSIGITKTDTKTDNNE